MYNLDYDIDKIIMIQKNIRNNLSIKNKLQNELDFILEITNKISLRVNNSYKKERLPKQAASSSIMKGKSQYLRLFNYFVITTFFATLV